MPQHNGLNLPFYIARRLAFTKERRFSKIIVRIATAAVAISVAVMIVATAFIAGFKTEISRKIFEFWGHLHISNTEYALSFEPSPIERAQPFLAVLDTLKSYTYPVEETVGGRYTGAVAYNTTHGGIQHVQVFAQKPGIIRTKTEMEGILLKGVGKDFDWSHVLPYIVAGKPLGKVEQHLPDSLRTIREILLSQSTADRLQVQVGDKFVVHFVKEGNQLRRLFQVCGIYKTGLEEYDRKFALCDLQEVQELLGWATHQVAGFEVWLDDLRDMEVYNDYIYSELLPQDFMSVSIRDKFPAIFEWLQLQDLNEWVILGLMLAVAIVNMITALLVLVLERTNMIGILKTLGETNGRIRQIFLYHAAAITLNGILWGNMLGLLFCWAQDRFRFIRLPEKDYYLSYAPVKVNLVTVLGLNVGTLLLTVIFLIIPAFVVATITPVKAIRFK